MTQLKIIAIKGLGRGREPTGTVQRLRAGPDLLVTLSVLSALVVKRRGKRPRDWPTRTCSVIPGNGENRDNDRWGDMHESAERVGTGEVCPGGRFKVLGLRFKY